MELRPQSGFYQCDLLSASQVRNAHLASLFLLSPLPLLFEFFSWSYSLAMSADFWCKSMHNPNQIDAFERAEECC